MVQYITRVYAIYDDDPANAEVYGNLYNWYAVDDERGVCPEGFHVPTDDDNMNLIFHLMKVLLMCDGSRWKTKKVNWIRTLE